MSKKHPALLLFSFLFVLAGCGQQPASSSVSSSAATHASGLSSSQSSSLSSSATSEGPKTLVIDGETFLEKDVSTYVRSKTNLLSTKAYYRQDGLKNIPYVKLKDFYHHLLGKEMTVSAGENGVYACTSAAGGTATIDTKNGILRSPDLEAFINTTIYRQEGASNTYYDGAPFLRVKSLTPSTPATAKTIRFAEDYGIKLYGYQGDVLMPIGILSNLFQGPTMLTCFYSTKAFYFVDPNDSAYEVRAVLSDPDYIKDTLAFFENGKRSPEQAAYSYGQYCFLLDNYYGLPGREAIHQTMLREGKLDLALQSHSDFTKKCRDYLRSTDQIEFYAGVQMLADHFADTGHTSLSASLMIYDSLGGEDIQGKIDTLFVSIGYSSADIAATRPGMTQEYANALTEAITQNQVQDMGTLVSGDTVIYTFTSFAFDVAGWKNYYAGNTDVIPEDQIGHFKRTLDKYKDDPAIKNVVVDISANGGGSADVVFTFMALMGKPTYLHYYDHINKNVNHTVYEVDANFDRKFDALDQQPIYPYHFGLLVSAYSFSCGNLLPVEAKENGLMLLGDTTGGGACAVIETTSAEGLLARSSSQIRLESLDGSPIDFGVEPHEKLITKAETGYDCSHLYDFGLISAKMNSFYQEA